jgi:hypothetical protein
MDQGVAVETAKGPPASDSVIEATSTAEGRYLKIQFVVQWLRRIPIEFLFYPVDQ